MKRFAAVILALVLAISLVACAKNENKADTSLKEGETSISGRVEEVNGNTLVICDKDGAKYHFTYSDDVSVVMNGWYVVDMTADSFENMDVTVICSQEILETYPMRLQNERMLIFEAED